MNLTVKLFAGLRDLAGCEQLVIDLDGSPRVADVCAAVVDMLPAGARDLAKVSRLAVDNRFAARDTEIHSDSEVALIPPVSGG